MKELFERYAKAFHKNGASAPKLDFGKFQQNLFAKAKLLQERYPGKKVVFKVVNKQGKISLQASVKG